MSTQSQERIERADEEFTAAFAANKDKPLPPDPDEQNSDRAEWAKDALIRFMEVTGAELDYAIGDLIADLRHLADRTGIDWEQQVANAEGHYEDETIKEEASELDTFQGREGQ